MVHVLMMIMARDSVTRMIAQLRIKPLMNGIDQFR